MAQAAIETAIYKLSYQAEGEDKVQALTGAVDALAKSTEIQVTQEERIEKATRTSTQAFERYLAKHDERFRAERQLRQELEHVRRYQEEGIGTAAQHATIIGSVTRRYQEQTGAAQGATEATRGMSAATAALKGAAYRATARLGPLGSILHALGPWGIAAGVAAGALSLGLVKAAREAEEAAEANRRFEAQLRATGGASGQTLDSLNTLIDGLKRTSRESEDALRQATSQLLVFRNVTGDAFERALQLSVDAALAFGSVESAARAIGKALNEPGESLRALAVAGGDFNDQQVKMLQAMAENGQMMEAQKQIIDELTASVGGTAVAATKSLAGSWDQLGKSIADLFQVIGKALPLKALAAAIDAQARIMSDAMDPMGDYQRQLERILYLQEQLKGATGLSRRGLEESIAREREKLTSLRPAGVTDADIAARAGRSALAAVERQVADAIEQATTATLENAAAVVKQYQEMEKLAAAQAKAIEGARREAEEKERLLAAYRESPAAYQRVQQEIAIENALRAQNLDLTTKQGQALADSIRRAEDAAGALKDLQEEENRRQQEIKRQEEERARALSRPFEQAAERIQGSFADMFTNIFETGEFKFKDLAASIKSTFARMLGELVTLALMRPIIVPIMTQMAGMLGLGGGAAGQIATNLGGGGGALNLLGGSFNLFGTSGVLGGLFGGGARTPPINPNVPSDAYAGPGQMAGAPGLASYGGAALGGAALGYGLSSVFGGGLAPTLGGTLGGAAGAIAGVAIGGMLGAVLGPVGAILGALIGSLFKKEPSNYVASLVLDAQTGGISKIETPKGAQNLDAAKNLASVIAQGIQRIQSLAGGELPSNRIKIDVGSRDGIQVYVNHQRTRLQYADPKAAATGTIEYLARSLTGLDPLVEQAIRGTPKGSSLDLLASNIEFAKSLKDLVTPALSQAELAVKQLKDTFDEAAVKARELGIDENLVTEARARNLRKLATEYERAAHDQLLQVRGTLADQLELLRQSYEQAKKDAVAYGASLVDIEEIYGLQRQRAIEATQEALAQAESQQEGMARQVLGFFDGLTGPIRSLMQSLTIGPQSILSPGAQLDLTRAAYEQQRALAQSGSVAAIQAFPGVAQQYLGVAQQFYAGGPGYTEIFRSVNESLMQVLGMVQETQTGNFGDLSLTIRDSLSEQTITLKTQLEKIERAVVRLTDQIAAAA